MRGSRTTPVERKGIPGEGDVASPEPDHKPGIVVGVAGCGARGYISRRN